MKRAIYIFVLVWCSISLEAKVKLPSLLSDYMVLQQQSDVRIWGEATPRSTVVVTPSWTTHAIDTRADASGHWEVRLLTPAADFVEKTLTVSDGESTATLHHLLIGEVWLCSGQSNMVMPLEGFDDCPVRNSNNVIADAVNHPNIRVLTLKPTVKITPQEYAEGSWQISNTENALKFSAVAYYYAMALQRTLHVPVGVIVCAWGGSRVEGWLPKDILETYPDEDMTLIGSNKIPVYLQSELMYNALLYPCRKYTVKGFLWYQGESNVRSNATYAERLATMVEHWRSLWGQGNLPFYYVEIAPYACGYKKEGEIGALLREAQQKALTLIPNSGMIGTNDLVESFEAPQVHPCNKQAVGERLAYLSLNKTYGFSGIDTEYPVYKSMEIHKDSIEISFSHAKKGLSPWIDICGFEIAGSDKIFHQAVATLNSKAHTVIVKSAEVKSPVAVRYCFRNFLKGNLVSARNLPVRPFRTDQWE